MRSKIEKSGNYDENVFKAFSQNAVRISPKPLYQIFKEQIIVDSRIALMKTFKFIIFFNFAPVSLSVSNIDADAINCLFSSRSDSAADFRVNYLRFLKNSFYR